jgi:hypothetical protein
LEVSSYGLIKAIPWHFPGATDEHHEKSVMIAGVPAEIHTEQLLNASVEHYLQTSLLCWG